MYLLNNHLRNYIKNKIGEVKSKEQEEEILHDDIKLLKEDIKQKKISSKKHWEIIVRILYAEILGYNTEFAHSFIVNSTHSQNYVVKRISYLACVLILESSSPLKMMIISSVQKDLENSCLINKIMALNIINEILDAQTFSSFVDLLLKAQKHSHGMISKKALCCLIKIERMMPGQVEGFDQIMESALVHSDFSIVMSVVPFYLQMVKKDANLYSHLLSVFMQIFEQIRNKKVNFQYVYNGKHAP